MLPHHSKLAYKYSGAVFNLLLVAFLLAERDFSPIEVDLEAIEFGGNGFELEGLLLGDDLLGEKLDQLLLGYIRTRDSYISLRVFDRQ